MHAVCSGRVPAFATGQLRAGDESGNRCSNELLNQHCGLASKDATFKGLSPLLSQGFRSLSTGRQSSSSKVALRQRISATSVLEVPSGPGSVGDSKISGVKTSPMAAVGSDVGLSSYMTAEERVYESVVKEAAKVERGSLADVKLHTPISTPELMREAYNRCGEVCEEYAKTFYLGTKLMTPERQRAIWAIYVWCRRTDELVDGPNASRITPRALDRWEERLEEIFNGQPYDMLDAALADTVKSFPLKIQPFRDMIEGMRMDLRKSRYADFNELYLYCYNVAGTVGLMSVPVMGIAPESKADPVDVYSTALALGIANQLTNILRDVGEDSRRGRVYLPQDELEQFGLSDEDIMAGKVTDKWREFMRFQIKRARYYFEQAESGVCELDAKSRWPVWASLSLYRKILDAVEANDYDNFTKRAYVAKWNKMLSLPGTYLQAQLVGPTKDGLLRRKASKQVGSTA